MTSDRVRAPRAPFLALLAALLALALQGCATVANPNPRDPWEGFNRPMHEFNDNVDRVVLKPVATLYREKVPALVRTGVSNFFGNLADAWAVVNNLLQFRLLEAEESLARFHLNTMFGVFGIFDIASDLNIERHREDFGQTLGRWGVPAGPYVVLPLLGPSTLRDAVAMPVDRRFDPSRYFEPTGLRNSLLALRAVDKRANLLRVGDVLEEASLDKYSFTRDAYLQRRRAEIFDRERDADADGGAAPPPQEERYDLPAPGQPAAPATR